MSDFQVALASFLFAFFVIFQATSFFDSRGLLIRYVVDIPLLATSVLLFTLGDFIALWVTLKEEKLLKLSPSANLDACRAAKAAVNVAAFGLLGIILVNVGLFVAAIRPREISGPEPMPLLITLGQSLTLILAGICFTIAACFKGKQFWILHHYCERRIDSNYRKKHDLYISEFLSSFIGGITFTVASTGSFPNMNRQFLFATVLAASSVLFGYSALFAYMRAVLDRPIT